MHHAQRSLSTQKDTNLAVFKFGKQVHLPDTPKESRTWTALQLT